MRPLSESIARLRALRGPPVDGVQRRAGRLEALHDFGSNPGNLAGWFHVPDTADRGAALVVVLHGCTQDAASYDRGAGWSTLADEQGFALLFPEQRRANNANLCFNWFEPGDSRRLGGEPESIVQMIEAMVRDHGLDQSRIFVTGLSAGGAMTGVMLATYPELFAAGAVIAGLPYGTASNVPQALERMRGQGSPSEARLAQELRAASSHLGAWPRISVWHGAADHVVTQANADAILAQWQAVHGLGGKPDRTERVDGHVRRTWLGPDGREAIEDYRIAGMGHGTPLATTGNEACGRVGPHMLEAGISSTRRIAAFWGLAATERAARSDGPVPANRIPDLAVAAAGAHAAPRSTLHLGGTRRSPAPIGVGKVIEDALRAAGLMR